MDCQRFFREAEENNQEPHAIVRAKARPCVPQTRFVVVDLASLILVASCAIR